MSPNHPSCQRNFLHLKLASPNENLICYYEHSWCLQRCLWVWDLKALNALNLQTNGFQAGRNWMYPLKWHYWKSLKMESDHLSAANDISSVQHRDPNGWWCVRYRDRVIPLDNNYRILSSQWLHLPQMPLQRLGNFLLSRYSCNGPEIDFLETRWELATVETLPGREVHITRETYETYLLLCGVWKWSFVSKGHSHQVMPSASFKQAFRSQMNKSTCDMLYSIFD